MKRKDSVIVKKAYLARIRRLKYQKEIALEVEAGSHYSR